MRGRALRFTATRWFTAIAERARLTDLAKAIDASAGVRTVSTTTGVSGWIEAGHYGLTLADPKALRAFAAED